MMQLTEATVAPPVPLVMDDPGRLGASMISSYGELRRLAQRYLCSERVDHTLQATALVHEAYLRLARRQAARWNGRAHFFNVAAREMRRVLVDHARVHNAECRGGDVERVPLEGDVAAWTREPNFDLVALDEALSTLSALDRRKGRIVELRFFGGMTIDETAALLGTSPVTVVREWRLAKAWLFRELGRAPARPEES